MYLLGSNYPAIIKIDQLTKETEYIDKPFIEKGLNQKDAYFRVQNVLKENSLYIPCCLDNTVLRLDLNTEDYEWLSVGENANRYSGIEYDGKIFYLSPRMNSHIVIWDGAKSINEIDLPSEYAGNMLSFGGCSKLDNEIIFWNVKDWNFAGRKSLKYMPVTGRLTDDNHQYTVIKNIDDLTVMQKSDGTLEIFKFGEKIFSEMLNVDITQVKKLYKEKELLVLDRTSPILEGDMFSLDNFITLIQDK